MCSLQSMSQYTNLVVFDLDGTLTDTTHVDEHAIVGALHDVLGVTGLSTDWSEYEHSTDAGIVHEVIQRERGTVSIDILHRVHDRCLEIMEQFYTSSPDLFLPINGATDVLKRLTDANIAVAIATGSWRESALFKLRVARIWRHQTIMATSDESQSRSEIISRAISQAAERYNQDGFQHVTYVGDGIWDARASRKLGLNFIGIASNGHAERLRAEGVDTILHDLVDIGVLTGGV